ncbi:MAG: NADP-dependent isocitrate dehydrogenase, partial [Planctomycetota bacterium]
MSDRPTILYTHTDEAPALATYSFLPILRTFAGAAGINVETRDISLAGRILSQFPERLTAEQRVADHLAELGRIALLPEANIIKLPNISASIPQLKAAIAELQAQGYDIPAYPEEPQSDAERDTKARYDSVKGSAVNPVLREGNSDRRAPKAVKAYARANPHRMGAWSADSKTHVASMGGGDFYANEQSVTVAAAPEVRIEHVAGDGTLTPMRKPQAVEAGEVLDATFLSKNALCAFLVEQIDDA